MTGVPPRVVPWGTEHIVRLGRSVAVEPETENVSTQVTVPLMPSVGNEKVSVRAFPFDVITMGKKSPASSTGHDHEPAKSADERASEDPLHAAVHIVRTQTQVRKAISSPRRARG